MINLDLTFFIQMINFIVLMVALNILLYRPVRKLLADRAAEIAGGHEKAAAIDQEVQDKMAQYEARLRDAKVKATEERGGLKKEAQAREAEILDKARKEAGESLAAIKGKVAREAADAKDILKEQARTLSLEICEKVLGRRL
ncbi:MAG TPA: ATP synthase F0 subunit B [Geobacteraceae bacterium]|nr:ATP synthase F0 subunit B [Geobacteraceae bacterium]